MLNILKICKELDIQLFATTHSQECIEDYAQAIEVVDSKDEARMILLQEYEKELYATTIFFRHIKAGLNANHKMLG